MSSDSIMEPEIISLQTTENSFSECIKNADSVFTFQIDMPDPYSQNSLISTAEPLATQQLARSLVSVVDIIYDEIYTELTNYYYIYKRQYYRPRSK